MTITVLQASGESDNAAAQGDRAFGSNLTANSLVVVLCWRWAQSTNDPFVAGDCTQSAGTATLGAITLDQTTSVNTVNGWFNVGIWSAICSGGGSATMRVGGNAGDAWGTAVLEASGNWDSNRVEGTNLNTGGSGNASTGNVTSAGAALFTAVTCIDMVSGAITPDAAYTQIFESEGTGSTQCGSSQYQNASVGTTDNANWTVAANTGWSAVQVAYREVLPPQVGSVNPTVLTDGLTGVAIVGSQFGASQGAGTVIISPTNNVADGSAVTQTVTAWADTAITFTAVRGSLGQGTLYLFVTENGGRSNSSGYPVYFAGNPIAWTRA